MIDVCCLPWTLSTGCTSHSIDALASGGLEWLLGLRSGGDADFDVADADGIINYRQRFTTYESYDRE